MQKNYTEKGSKGNTSSSCGDKNFELCEYRRNLLEKNYKLKNEIWNREKYEQKLLKDINELENYVRLLEKKLSSKL